MARRLVDRHDAIGSELVIAETTVARLTQLSHHIHQTERRCGGYFAFDTREEAEAFLRSDRAAEALTTTFLADYPIDNQATVDPWLPQVVGHNIYDTLTHLSSAYPNRYYASSHGQSAAVWIRDTWLALANDRSDVSAELFTDCSDCSTQPSVILTIQGAEQPDEIVVLGAHLDSISNAGSGDDMDAPGADDDGSGIATLTEVLRVALADGWRPRRTVKFMGYAAEEVGLRGSRAIAQSFQDEGRNVVGVLQLDMTNYKGGSSVDMRVMTDYTNPQLSQFLKDLFDEYLAPLGLARGTYTCGYACSDHASWTSAGYPSAMMFEATLFPNLHTPYDTLANMDDAVGSSVNFAKLGLAFLGELGKTADGSSGFFENTADYAIEDNAIVRSPITVSGMSGSAPADLAIAVTIRHANRGDLRVDLVAPSGSVYRLHNRGGDGYRNLVRTYTRDVSSETANGTWKLRVNDGASPNTGRIDKWSLQF